MKDISKILKELNLLNYKFHKKENIIKPGIDNVYQIIELVNINAVLEKNNIKYNIDKYNNIHLN